MQAPEAQLLLWCARACVDAATAERIRTLVAQPLRWDYVLELASWHRVRPLLYRHLQDLVPEAMPADVLDSLRRFFKQNATGNLQKSAALLKILKRFEAENIAVIPQKGPVLATTVFGDVGLREFVDLDIVVQPPDIPRAMRTLLDMGYEVPADTPLDFPCIPSKSQYGLRHATYGIEVELHWKLLQDRLAYHFDMAAMWERLGTATLHGKTVRSLSDEDLLLVLCAHGTEHYWMRLHWLCCVAELLRVKASLDWHLVFKQADRIGAMRTLGLSLLLANTLLDAPLPDSVQQRLNADAALRPLAEQVIDWIFFAPGNAPAEPMPPSAMQRAWFHLRVRERLQDGVAYGRFRIQKLLTPTAQDHELVSLPAPLSFLYYPLRLLRVVGSAGQRGFKSLVNR